MALLTELLTSHLTQLEPFALDKHFLRKHGAEAYFYQTK